MEQEDLMIGDIVRSKSDGSIIKIATHWDIYNAKDFEPVSITHERLKKIGLSHYANGAYSFDEFAIYSMNSGYKFVSSTDRRTVQLYVQYVHELQHALKLCGIEKEIVL